MKIYLYEERAPHKTPFLCSAPPSHFFSLLFSVIQASYSSPPSQSLVVVAVIRAVRVGAVRIRTVGVLVLRSCVGRILVACVLVR